MNSITGAALHEETEALAREHLFPARLEIFHSMGMDLVMGRREGYRVWDVDGRDYLDLDLSGIHNLGHRNPELVATLHDALEMADIGHPFFARPAQADLAAKLAGSIGLQYAVFTPSGTEANEVAIRTARRHTGRRKIVSCNSGYHGATGLAAAAGNPGGAASFYSDYPNEFLTVDPVNIEQVEALLKVGDVAGLILEPVTQAAGYPMPPPGYWEEVQALCGRYGTVLIIDEVVTGLGKTGCLWGCEHFRIQPDVMVVGKALSGGLYPIAACLISNEVGGWLREEMFGYGGSYAGSELGCIVAAKVLELSSSETTLRHVHKIGEYFAGSLRGLQEKYPHLRDFTQLGHLFALHFTDENAMLRGMGACFEHGLIVNVAASSPRHASILVRPGLFVDKPYCDEVIERLDKAIHAIA